MFLFLHWKTNSQKRPRGDSKWYCSNPGGVVRQNNVAYKYHNSLIWKTENKWHWMRVFIYLFIVSQQTKLYLVTNFHLIIRWSLWRMGLSYIYKVRRRNNDYELEPSRAAYHTPLNFVSLPQLPPESLNKTSSEGKY